MRHAGRGKRGMLVAAGERCEIWICGMTTAIDGGRRDEMVLVGGTKRGSVGNCTLGRVLFTAGWMDLCAVESVVCCAVLG